MKNASSCVFKQITGLLYFCSDRGVGEKEGMVLVVVVEMMLVMMVVMLVLKIGMRAMVVVYI